MSDLPETVTLDIALHIDKFDSDPDYAPQFYDALGRLVVIWGRYEHLLTVHLRTVLNLGALFGMKGSIRNSIGAKVEIIQKFYKHLGILSQHYEAVTKITNEAKTVAKNRNYLIHSQVEGFIDGDPPRIQLIHHEHKGGGMTVRSFRPTVEEIVGITDDANQLLNQQMSYFLAALQDHQTAVKTISIEPRLASRAAPARPPNPESKQ